MDIYTVEQLAHKLDAKIGHIRQQASKSPSSLPPRLVIPGSRRVYFCRVDEWLESLAPPLPQQNSEEASRGRGRPRKIAGDRK